MPNPTFPPIEHRNDLESWRGSWTPKVGDRVRVRLSPECQFRYLRAARDNKPISVNVGHAPEEDGATGTVIDLASHGLGWARPKASHPFTVDFDTRITLSDCYLIGSSYAASELEPLDSPDA